MSKSDTLLLEKENVDVWKGLKTITQLLYNILCELLTVIMMLINEIAFDHLLCRSALHIANVGKDRFVFKCRTQGDE